ncbi:D-hexose-6-phosphate mutarotase [Agarivorans sp. 1_MG-2023]|uniref:D-hexose-6-phosphate mutarotase n=1 Tax=Agarivorans sp. 1_MG-2023 TaxID=3062634 RepID=UPI0026E480A0|nr:D-hexose-6-phosphate mutarotase [Agarivorans sp. 1_MG-2023]MDO6765903.1 D-hexose-6-phosphate mutarotase [Agarivorans sp. 1_MG-2023]
MILEKLQLKVVKQLDNAVFEVHNNEGMVFYWVDHPAAKALIAQQGAHLVSYRPNPGEEKLWLSDDSLFTKGAAIRGGIPICWPNFGNLGNENNTKHGYARTSLWTLNTITTSQEHCYLNFSLPSSSNSGVALSCSFTLGAEARIELVTTNHSEKSFEYTGALHSYFITDVKKLHIGSLGDQYIDSVSSTKVDNVASFTLSDETDRIYLQPQSVSQLVFGASKTTIEHRGHDSVVVWNPGDKLANKMPDVSSAENFICVETAITQQPQAVKPQQSHKLVQIIR